MSYLGDVKLFCRRSLADAARDLRERAATRRSLARSATLTEEIQAQEWAADSLERAAHFLERELADDVRADGGSDLLWRRMSS